ncbi:MAG: TetR/AcrR family transcriptional regulator [Oscillospiraceae bacterium]|jgi:AcrR family transcriptional regulator|nr:TetR/AcrR family transcriptional regulator [Oscillospiraceae bacterium]
MRKGDSRRGQIIETAERLFYRNGYEQTSVQDIIDALAYSKGGFYHHFDSKLALLDAICENRADQTRQSAARAVNACAGGPVDKLNALFEQSSLWREDNLDYISLLLRVAYREDGALMRDKLKQYSLRATLPILDSIIADGVSSRVFFVPHADLAGEMILRLSAQFTDEIAFQLNTYPTEDVFLPLLLDKLELYRHAVERILEAPFGSVTLFSLSRLTMVCRTVLSRT